MILDIIEKKKNGSVLSKEELENIFFGFQDGKVKDYQMSAFLMAICINGMEEQEIFDLVDIFIRSGEIMNLDFLDIPVVDKHSTGGVGDKTTLIVAPIVASLGIPVVKMSGRGLGYTGGTIDKLESIPGFQVDLEEEQIKKQAKDIGLVITSQTKNLTPLDKMVYALRDVSGTVSSVALIASSIMSKKIAGGASKIVIDVKKGNGALLQKDEDINYLCELLVKIGNFYEKEVRVVVSDMNEPLGITIGNKLEVLEAIRVLQNKQKGKLVDKCLELASQMISLGKNISVEEARDLAKENLENQKAYQKFLEFVAYQKGDINALHLHAKEYAIYAKEDGILKSINALECAKLALDLGAGRKEKEDAINYDAGIILQKNVGEIVKKSDILATVYTNKNIGEIDSKIIFEIA